MPDAVARFARSGNWRRWFAPAARPHRVFLQADAAWHRAPGAGETVRVDGWAAWCAAHAGQAVQVVLSGRLTAELLAPAGLPLQRRDDAAAWAGQQWQHYHGAAAQSWPVAAWPNGASALTGLPLASLLDPAQAHRVSLLGLRPWWSVAGPAVRRVAPEALPGGRGVLWLLEERLATRMVVRDGALGALEPRWLDEATPAALDRLIAEYAEDAGPQWVIGHGFGTQAGAMPALQRARAIGRLAGPVPNARWWGR